MDGVWLILAIIWFIVRAATKNKKAGKVLAKLEKTDGGVVVQELKSLAKEAVKEAKEAAEEAKEALETPREQPVAVPEAAVPAAQSEPIVMMRHEAALEEGESCLDDEGCIGGSLEHGHEEGAPAAAQAAASARTGLESARPRMTAAEMRRAVIASEVLRAPLTLRGRQRGGLAR